MGEDGTAAAGSAAANGVPPGFRFARLADRNTALGLAVRFLREEPVFAALPFAELAGILDGQAARGEYGFVLDGAGRVRGFMGWACTTRERADAWAAGAALGNEECGGGEGLIVNVWMEKDSGVHGFMVGQFRALLVGKTAAYARRIYPGGRVRTMRLPIDPVVSSRPAAGSLPPQGATG